MLKKFLAALLAGTAVVGAAAQAAVPTIAVGLALALSSSAAMAAIDPIPGVDIIVRKRPGGIALKVKTGADGTYKFTGLASGNYDLIIPGQPVKSVTVSVSGVLSGIVTLINSVDTTNDTAVTSKAHPPAPRSH